MIPVSLFLYKRAQSGTKKKESNQLAEYILGENKERSYRIDSKNNPCAIFSRELNLIIS